MYFNYIREFQKMSSNTDLTIKYRSASSPIPPFLPTNPFYDVNNWDCYAKTSSRGGGSSSSISTDVSMELEFFCEEALTPVSTIFITLKFKHCRLFPHYKDLIIGSTIQKYYGKQCMTIEY